MNILTDMRNKEAILSYWELILFYCLIIYYAIVIFLELESIYYKYAMLLLSGVLVGTIITAKLRNTGNSSTTFVLEKQEYDKRNTRKSVFRKITCIACYIIGADCFLSGLLHNELNALPIYHPYILYLRYIMVVVCIILIFFLYSIEKKMIILLKKYWEHVITICICIYLPIYALWLNIVSVYFSYFACFLTGLFIGIKVSKLIIESTDTTC